MTALATLPIAGAIAMTTVAAASARAADFIWWEGERPAATNFPAKSDFSADTFPAKRDVLSGGDWLTNSGPRAGPEAYAKYDVEVPAAGAYDLWCRKFWKHGPFRWRFDEGAWRECGPDVALADEVSIRQYLGANWVYLGRVELAAGTRRFELRLLAKEGENLTAAFDCFLLSDRPFVPRGKLKPGEKSGLADPGRFAWEPAPDKFGKAELDLRRLNEAEAGEHGWIARKAMTLVDGEGRTVRFWGVNAGPGVAALDHASLDALARTLAKAGVNLVRHHGAIWRDGNPAAVDPAKLDNLHYFTAALKKQGIYSHVSSWFPLWLEASDAQGLEGYDASENKKPFALLFFHPVLQGWHRTWLTAILGTRNPYTGRPLGKDPALAAVEIQNEDSFFFWTFSPRNIPPPQWRRLETLYGAWLAQRHGSIAKAQEAWLEAREKEDAPAEGRMALYDAWRMTRDGIKDAGPGLRARVSDQVRFLAETQRGYYAATVRYLKRDLGYRGLVACSNWVTADPAQLEALEQLSYTAGDLLDRHGYFDAKHEGTGAGWSVAPGHVFENKPAVKHPEDLPLQFTQADGMPCLISEIGWTNPNLYRADMPFLTAAYGALQGLDACEVFALGGAFWDTAMGKFAASCPVILGSFPACALLFRRGDVTEAPDAVFQALDPEDLYALKGSGQFAAQALDELRRQDVPGAAVIPGEVRTLDPLTFYVGRVVRSFAGHPERSRRAPLANFLNRDEHIVRSLTGELAWDFGRGIVRLDAKRSQGAAGFLAQAARVELTNLVIEAENEYATVLAVSLDGKPLASSARILVQAMTTERPYGFRASEGAQGRILDAGGWPFGVEKLRIRVTLKGGDWRNGSVTPLDEHGYARPEGVEATAAGDGSSFTVRLLEDSVYYILRR